MADTRHRLTPAVGQQICAYIRAGGYPPVAVRPEDRPAYIAALQDAQAGRGSGRFDRLLYERLDSTLEESLSALQEALTAPTVPAPQKPKVDKLAS